MRKSKKEDIAGPCDVSGCSKEVHRSLPRKKVDKALSGHSLKGDGRRAKICKDHYRDFKKATKKDRKLESLGR